MPAELVEFSYSGLQL